jgi:hypothetical protein
VLYLDLRQGAFSEGGGGRAQANIDADGALLFDIQNVETQALYEGLRPNGTD